jgi:adenine phosphoribosyltransferase
LIFNSYQYNPQVDISAAQLIRNIPDFPKPGILFKDITPLLADPKIFKQCCQAISNLATDADYIAGIEARGFIFAAAVATMSNKGFIPIRKSGKLPGETISKSYDLEYGQATLEIHANLIAAGKKVLIVDDVLATGGTAVAATDLIIAASLIPTSLVFLLEIPALGGRSRIKQAHSGLQIQTILAE